MKSVRGLASRPAFWDICREFGAAHGQLGWRDDGIELLRAGRRMRIVAGEVVAPGWEYTPDPGAGVVVTLGLEQKLGVWARPEGTGRLVGARSPSGAPPDSPGQVLAGLLGAGAGEGRSPHDAFASRCPNLIARCGALQGSSFGINEREAWGELAAGAVTLESLETLCALVTDLALAGSARDSEMRAAFPRRWTSPQVREGRRIYWRTALKLYAVIAVVIFVLWSFRSHFR